MLNSQAAFRAHPMADRVKLQGLSIRALLEWSFGREQARLDFDELGSTSGGGHRSFGMEYVLLQRLEVGCVIDGGGRSEPHDDADLVASVLGDLPIGNGGRWMAMRVAEYARIGRAPDCMADAVPACVPVNWRNHKHGPRAATISMGAVRYAYRGRIKETEVFACPVTYRPSPSQIGSARRHYLDWWGALDHLRWHFQTHGGLTRWTVTDDMPPRTPWKKEG